MDSGLLGEVPADRRHLFTALHKTRIRFQNKPATVAIFAATVNETLELFSNGKQLSTYTLPLSNCCKLLHLPFISSSLKHRNFIIALSESNCVIVLDLDSELIVKRWDNIENIEARDEQCLGSPQLVLTIKGINKKQSIVTPEYNWEPCSDFTDEHEKLEEAPAVHSVVTALENQLKSACNELHIKQNQLLLRRALVNRSLSALSRAVALQPCNSRAPSYTIPIGESQQGKQSHSDSSDSCLPIKASEVWQVVDFSTNSWIIGTAFQNMSDSILSNIRCALVIKNSNAPYSITCYLEEKASKVPIKTCNGSLQQGERLFLIAVTGIPDFASEDVEVSNLFLTCNLSSHPEKLFQYNLGDCALSFQDMEDDTISFNHSTHNQPIPHEQLFGLLSILPFEEKYAIEALNKENLPPKMLHSISKKLELLYDPTARCYYSFSFYGHVAILVLSEEATRVEIRVQTRGSREMRMFTRHLKNNLDGLNLTFLAPESPADATPHDLLTAGFDLISSGKREDEDEPMVIAEERSTNPIDKIRNAFLRKQKLVMNASSGSSANFVIPNDVYCKWQDNYFALEKC